MLDAVIASGSSGTASLLVTWTGAITPLVPGANGGNTTAGSMVISGNEYGAPGTVTGASFTIDASHRALYLVLRSDCFHSPEDGLWPSGQGFLLDNLATSDNGSLYADQAAAGGVDGFGGNVIRGTPGAPILSARVPASAAAG